jgi:hypothetical protein
MKIYYFCNSLRTPLTGIMSGCGHDLAAFIRSDKVRPYSIKSEYYK